MNTNLKWTIIAGLFLIPVIPFVVSGSLLFPFITGKNFLFRFLVEVVFALWLILIVKDTEYRPKFSWILGSVAIFTLIIGVADVFAENPTKALWSNFERMEGFVSLVHFFLYFLVVSSVFHTIKQWTRFLYAWVISTAVMCMYGFLQLAGKITINQGGVRVDGTLGNANYLAVFLMFGIFFGLFILLRSSNVRKAAYIIVPAIIAQITILYFTATRGSILGLIGGVFVTVLLTALFEKERPLFRKVATGGVIGIIIFIGGFIALRDSRFVTESPVLSRFSSLSISELKTQGRFFIWPMAIQGFKERPVLGWGQEGFSYVFNKYYNPQMYAQEQWFDRAHNMFLDWLIAGGLLGLISFLAILFFAFWYLWKDSNHALSFAEKSLLTGLLCAYIFQGIFVFDNLIGYILFFSLIAFIHAVRGGNHMNIPQVFEKESVRRFVGPSVCLILIVGLYMTVWVPLRSGQALIRALRAIQSNDPSLSLAEFKTALAYDSLGSPEIREQLITTQGSFFKESTPEAIRGEYIDLVRSEYQKQFAQAPNDARYYLFYGTFLRSLGLQDMAIENFKKSLELSPRKQTILIEIGLTYLQGKQYDKALEYLQRASDSDSSYIQAKIYYGVAALYKNDIQLANTIFNSIPERVLLYDERVVQAFVQTGRFQELVKIFSRRIADGEDTYQNTLNLAVSYLEGGNRESAAQVLERFLSKSEVQMNAETKAQLEYYIKEIRAGRNP